MHDDPSRAVHDRRFEALVTEYARLIRGVVARVAGPRTHLVDEDAEQEIKLALWKQVSQGRDIAAPVSYLYKAAVRETVRAVRAVHAARRAVLDEATALPSSTPDPHAMLEAADLDRRLQAALESLPLERRRAVEAHLSGLSVDEIRAVTGWTYHRARNLIARGMADLRTRMASPPDS